MTESTQNFCKDHLIGFFILRLTDPYLFNANFSSFSLTFIHSITFLYHPLALVTIICKFINLLPFLMEIIYLDLHILNLGEEV